MAKKKKNNPDVGASDRRAKHEKLRQRRLVRKQIMKQKGVA
jgi:hypothetical protein